MRERGIRFWQRGSAMMLASAGAAWAYAQEEGSHAEPNLFAGDLGNVVWTLLIFVLVVTVLGKFAWRPLLSALNEREKTIRESLEEARRERERANQLFAEYEAKLAQAATEAAAIVEEGRRDAEAVRRRIQEESRKEADETLQRARREIQLAGEAAVKELYDRTAELAVQAAGGIIRKTLSPDDHRQLVAESLERMRASRSKLN